MTDRFSFDPLEYLLAIWQMLPVLILSLMIGAVGGTAYDSIVADHLYAATTKFYVISGDWATQGRTDDYSQIITSQPVTRTVITREELKDENGNYISQEEFLGMLEVSAYDETHVIGITFFNQDPYRACDVANELREVSIDAIKEIMDPGKIETVQNANIPVTIAKPNSLLHCVIGSAILFVASLGTIFLIMLIIKRGTDKRLKAYRFPCILALLLLGFSLAVPFFVHETNVDRIGPDIIIPEMNITYNEGDDFDVLLQGVKAEDIIDGDCTEFIRIDGVHVSDSGESCIIDYVVKDRSNNVSTAERYASYNKRDEEEELTDN